MGIYTHKIYPSNQSTSPASNHPISPFAVTNQIMTSHHIQVHLKRTTKHLHIYLQSQIKLRLNERGESGVLTPVHWYVSQTRMRATKYAPNVSSADASTLVCLSHGSQCCHHVSFRPPRLHASWRSDGSSCRGGPHQLWVGLVNCSRWIGGPDPSKKNHTCIYRKKKSALQHI